MERFFIPSLKIGVLSGVILGILLLIPFISPLIFFLMFILSGIAVIVILKRHNSVGLLSIYDGCSIGAISGFVSLLSASIIYVPITFLLGRHFSIKGYEILAVLMVTFCAALLSALFNAFSGLVTAYIYEKIENRNIKFQDHFDLTMEKGEDTI